MRGSFEVTKEQKGSFITNLFCKKRMNSQINGNFMSSVAFRAHFLRRENSRLSQIQRFMIHSDSGKKASTVNKLSNLKKVVLNL